MSEPREISGVEREEIVKIPSDEWVTVKMTPATFDFPSKWTTLYRKALRAVQKAREGLLMTPPVATKHASGLRCKHQHDREADTHDPRVAGRVPRRARGSRTPEGAAVAISTPQWTAAIRPGLTAAFEKSFGEIWWGPQWPDGWEELYKRALEHVRRERWLSEHRPSVEERLRRHNPTPWPEGGRIRGWHPRCANDPRWTHDVVRLEDYRRKWGDECDVKIVHQKGRAKYVSRLDYKRGPMLSEPQKGGVHAQYADDGR